MVELLLFFPLIITPPPPPTHTHTLNIGKKYRGRIHDEGRISLRFLGIILRFFRLEVSVCNVYITYQFQTTFARGGVKSL